MLSGGEESLCWKSKNFVFLRKLLGSVLEIVPTTTLHQTGNNGSNLCSFVMPQLDLWFDELNEEFLTLEGLQSVEVKELLRNFEADGV